MHADLKTIAALIAVLAAAVSMTPAQRFQPPSAEDKKPHEEGPRRLGRPAPLDLNQNATLIEAAKTTPAPAEALARLIPEKMGAFSRTKLDAQVKQIGPALYSEVRAQLEGKGAQQMSLLLVDTGGLRAQAAPPVLDLLPAGGREQKGALVRKAFDVGGYPGVSEDLGPQMARRIQVRVSERVRLTLETSQASCADMIAAARAMNLKAVAALAGGASSGQ